MSSLSIGGISISKGENAETLLASISDLSQEKFENSLRDLLEWLSVFRIEKIVFQAGGNLVLPDWFIHQCRQLGIQVEVRSSNPAVSRVVNALDELYSAIASLSDDAAKFFGSCIEDASRELRHRHCDPENPFWIVDIYRKRGASSFEELALQALQEAYDLDNHRLVSDVCGSLYGTAPKTGAVRQILRRGILDSTKSNRLRERFFWVFNYGFKSDSINFFLNEIQEFLDENEKDEDLCADIINFLHWNMKDNPNLGGVVKIINTYLNKYPVAKSKIYSPTKELLGLA